MRRLVPLLALAACEQDISIDDDARITGANNPPSLATPVRTDRITQTSPPEVDILWVIDNSGSMSDKQRKLATEFDAFARFFEDSGVVWQMGVITTDMDNPEHQGRLVGGRSTRILSPETPDWAEEFKRMARVGDGGSGDEKGRAAIMAALTDPLISSHNDGFYREDAFLQIIVISDENDSSASDPTRGEFVDFLRGLKPDPEMVTFNAIVGPRNLFTCISAEPGTEYLEVVDQLGGLSESICAQDWVPMLEQLGLQASGVKQEFFLSSVPVPGTIAIVVTDKRVTWEGIDQETLRGDETVQDVCESAHCFGFTYDGFRNSVIFDGYVPAYGAKVEITYELMSGFQVAEEATP